MAIINNEQLQSILDGAPKQARTEDILFNLFEDGHQVEGVDEALVRQRVAQRKASQPAPTVVEGEEDLTFGERAARFAGGVRDVAADVSGVRKLGEGFGQALGGTGFLEEGVSLFGKEIVAPGGRFAEQAERQQAERGEMMMNLANAIVEKEGRGEDATNLRNELARRADEAGATAEEVENLLNPFGITPKQVAGSALQTGVSIASLGTFGKAAAGAKAGKLAVPTVISPLAKATSIGQGAKIGAATGAFSGAAFGAPTGVAQALLDDVELKDLGKEMLKGTITGGVFGALVGGATGAVAGKINERRIIQEIAENRKAASAPGKMTMTQARQDPKHFATDPTGKKFFQESLVNMDDIRPLSTDELVADRAKALITEYGDDAVGSDILDFMKNDITAQLRNDKMNATAQLFDNIDTSDITTITELQDEMADALSRFKPKDKFVRELITPKLTKKQAELAIKSGRVRESKGLLGKRDFTPALRDMDDIQREVAKVQGVSAKKSILQNSNEIKKEIARQATQLQDDLKGKGFFSPDEWKGYMDGVRETLDDNPLLVGDAEKTATKMLNKFDKLLKKNGYTPQGLLNSRKQFDTWMAIQKGDTVFDPVKENAVSIAMRGVRQGANDFLEDFVEDVSVKQSLRNQSLLYEAVDNMAPKAAKEGQSAIRRWIQTHPRSSKVIGFGSSAIGLGYLGGLAGSAAAE